MSSVTTLYPDLPFEGRFMDDAAKAEALGFDPDIFKASGGYVGRGSRYAQEQAGRNNLRKKAAEAEAEARGKMAAAQAITQQSEGLQQRARRGVQQVAPTAPAQGRIPVSFNANSELAALPAAAEDPNQSDLMKFLLAAIALGNGGYQNG